MTKSLPTVSPSTVRNRRHERGNAMIEFALVFILFLSIFIGFGQICLALFTKATLHHAVREGVREAITGAVIEGKGHDSTIREAVKEASLGFLKGTDGDQYIKIQYYDEEGGGATDRNTGGNLVVVTVENYQLDSMFHSPWFSMANPTFTVSAVDKLEPFPKPPDREDPEEEDPPS